MIWQVYIELLQSMLARYYSSSLARPWIRSQGAARTDALYRLAVLVAAPLLLVTALLIVCAKWLFPQLFPGRTSGFAFAGAFLLIGPAVNVTLNAAFGDMAELAESYVEPRTRAELVFEIVSWASMLGYVFSLLLLT
jgi:hypothetical protein